MAKLGFIGLGVMGGPIAGHLAAAGHELVVYNRTRLKADAWADRHGGRVASSPAEAADGAAAVIACVGTDDDVREVASAAFPAMAPGTVWIDHSTVSAKARPRAGVGSRVQSRILALDAPVSGGEAGAQAGKLAAMCGGSAAAFDAAKPYLDIYCARSVLIGEAGSGQLAKMVNQIAIAGVVEGLAEAVHFTKKAGLDPAKVFDAISGGAAASWQMLNRWPTMVEGNMISASRSTGCARIWA